MQEILVHITAPTTHKDDDIYRSLADAYLNFEPYQPENVSIQREDTSPNYHDATDLNNHRTSSEENTASMLPRNFASTTSKESYGSFPSRLVYETGDQVQEPAIPPYSSEWRDRSLIDTSRLEQLERIQSKWKGAKSSGSNHPEDPLSDVNLTASNLQSSFIEDSQLAARVIQSQLPDNLSTTSEDTSEDKTEDKLYSVSAIPISSSFSRMGLACSTQFPHETRPELSPMSHGPKEARRPEKSIIPRAAVRTALRTSPATFSRTVSERQINEADTDCQETLDFNQLPLEVIPPTPKISTKCPGALPSQVTKYLSTIKQQNPNRFKPSQTLRAVDSDERGYWLVDTGKWPLRTQYDFWLSLCDHVRTGRFGWGVLLYREPSTQRSDGVQNQSRLGQVRLYCWGEIIEHVWLALWLFSLGRVSRSGSTWFDAGDAVVVQVL